VLLGRPGGASGIETVNDLDGFVANFWRSVRLSPEATAEHADNPVNENDLHARHSWLVGKRPLLRAQLEGDPDWHDPKIAGWWVWGMACWIGCGFCSGTGPWSIADGQLVHLGDAGRGVTRQRALLPWFYALAERMARVRVCSGDWSRVCGPTPTHKLGATGVFLDPPYSTEAGRDMDIYIEDCGDVAHAVREWALEQGKRPDMRIALCGYEGEHEMPGWDVAQWKAHGGYGNQGEAAGRENAHRERIWFSPACLRADQGKLQF
jgi:hypothetical protein